MSWAIWYYKGRYNTEVLFKKFVFSRHYLNYFKFTSFVTIFHIFRNLLLLIGSIQP